MRYSPKDANLIQRLKSNNDNVKKFIFLVCQNVVPAPTPTENAWKKGKPDFVPAGPPKENVWEKRKQEAQSKPPSNQTGTLSTSWILCCVVFIASFLLYSFDGIVIFDCSKYMQRCVLPNRHLFTAIC